ncbi:MAG: type II secretion system GspH family protein [Planctomycetes bacterium]|nr:type II secretion system GspH family protein [Planctomycetota bacterium]
MQRNRTSQCRRGMTLTELMVVVMIMVILLGIALPMMRPALEDRRIREASRQFNAFLRAAQARAAESGRSYGIWIERDEVYPNIAYQVYFADSPPPYAGETQDAAVSGISGVDLNTPWFDQPNNIRYSPQVRQTLPWVEGLRPQWLRSVTLTGAFSLEVVHPESDAATAPLVRRGDTIRFNFTGPDYLIYDIVTEDSPLTSDNPNTTMTIEPPVAGDLYAGRQPHPNTGFQLIIGPSITDRHTHNPNNAPSAAGPIFSGAKFQIERQPQRTAAGSLTLPNTTAIVLSLSGGQGVIRTNSSGTLLDDFHEFRALPLTPPAFDDTPVVLMFRSDGSVDIVASSSGGVGIPNGPLYFLVGRADVDEGEPVTISSPAPAIQDDLTWQALDDPNSLWLVVNDRTGAITTSQNTVWLPALVAQGLPLTAPLVTKTRAARGLARTGISVGGN